MKLLVLGGSYFLGKCFVEMAKKEHSVTVLNRGSRPLSDPEIRQCRGDRHQEASYKQPGIAGESFDAVVDFCAYEKGDIAFTVESLEKTPRSYLFVSTSDVYRRGNKELIDESAALEDRDFGGPEGQYILGKVALEKELADLASRKGFSYYSVRPAFIYGPDNYAPRDGVYFNWIEKAGQILDPVDADGEFQAVFVEDVARAILFLLQHPECGNRPYNLCGPEILNYAVYRDTLSKISSIPFTCVEISVEDVLSRGIPLPFPLTGAESHCYDGSAMAELGFSYTPFEQGMRQTMEAYFRETDIATVLQTLDEMFRDKRIGEVEEFLLKNYEAYKAKERWMDVLAILNELIGYYRVTTRYDRGAKVCEEVCELIQAQGLSGSVDEGTSLLNVATIYRAMGELEKAESAYNRAAEVYREKLGPKDYRLASLYNNMSLLYQAWQKNDSSVEYLKKALEILKEKEPRSIDVAITYSNLGQAYIGMEKYDLAQDALQNAWELFLEINENDTHFSGCCNALGTFCMKRRLYGKAIFYYERALWNVYLSSGKSQNYETIRKNLMEAYAAEGRPVYDHMLDLCRAYYEEYGKPMIESRFPEYADRIAVGLCGEGSECFGFDDEISRDHDCGPGFSLWVTDEVYGQIGRELQEAYEALPRVYAGEIRTTTAYGSDRCGVCTIDGFYARVLNGCTVQDGQEVPWNVLTEDMLATATNGEVFTDPEGIFTEKRRRLLVYYPESLRLERLARNLMIGAQSGQYNYGRMMARKEVAAARMALSEYVGSVFQIIFLLNKTYMPYYKWRRRALDRLPKLREVGKLLDRICLLPLEESVWEGRGYENAVNGKDDIAVIIEQIAEMITKQLRDEGLSNSPDLYLETQGKEVAGRIDRSVSGRDERMGLCEKDKETSCPIDLERKTETGSERERLVKEIVLAEWEAFDQVQNEGGRANCQDDWPTFSVMRKSQYLTWPEDMLRMYLEHFTLSFREGRNLITEKYGRMMKSTAPERYEELCEHFPEISPERELIQESIIAIQVEWMEQFAEKYPAMAGNARSIHTSEDTAYNTSFETYLWGEISTYSEELLVAYGRFVVSLKQAGENLSYLTMRNTALLYGYHSVEDAEAKLKH